MSRKPAIPRYLVAIFLIAWALLTLHIGSAWFGQQDANGAWISVAVRNYQLHGFFALGGIVDINTDLLGAMMPYTHHPPLVVWMSALPVLLVGYDESILRFVMASCTLIGAAALYVLARRLGGRAFALLSTAFYLVVPMIAYFGRMPDHEAPALMFSLLFAALLVGWLRTPTRRDWWGLVALTILAVWTAWGALIVIGVLTVAALFYTRRRFALIMLGVVALGALIAMYGYYVYFYRDAIPDLINAFIWRTSSSSLEVGSVAFTTVQYLQRIAVRVITLYTPTVALLALIGAWLALRRRGLLRGMLIALLVAGVGYMLMFRNASYIHDYYMMYVSPGLALLAGAALTLLPHRSRWLRPLVVSLALVTLPAALFYLGEIYSYADPTLGLNFAQVVHDHTAPSDLIMSSLPTIGDAVEFYAERTIQWGITPDQALEQASHFSGSVYYLHCGSAANLPANTPSLGDVEITPDCHLTRLG